MKDGQLRYCQMIRVKKKKRIQKLVVSLGVAK